MCPRPAPLQPPNAFKYTFQLALPFIGESACLEVCDSATCPLPAADYAPDASWVYLNPACPRDTMAGQWRSVPAGPGYAASYIRLQNIQTSKCLHINNTLSLKAHTGEIFNSHRVLAVPCAPDIMPASNNPQLFESGEHEVACVSVLRPSGVTVVCFPS